MSSNPKLDELVQQMEHYVECWKQLGHYVSLARSKQFSPEDEDQFLEIKSVLTQELEMILAAIEGGATPSKEDVHALIGETSSIRFLSELDEGGLKTVESKWHKLLIGWQSALGQIKAIQKQQAEVKPRWSLFGRRKS